MVSQSSSEKEILIFFTGPNVPQMCIVQTDKAATIVISKSIKHPMSSLDQSHIIKKTPDSEIFLQKMWKLVQKTDDPT